MRDIITLFAPSSGNVQGFACAQKEEGLIYANDCLNERCPSGFSTL